jgi:large subunit ribosomal protein L22
MSSRATLRFARVSAQKARLVVNLVRGMDVPEALETLSFTRKKTAPMVRKLVESAVANAKTDADRGGADFDEDELYVQTITVDAGPSLRRFRPRAQGRATRIQKKTSHITVVLGTR